MSTEIKPGQVWQSVHNNHETATIRELRDGEVWATDNQSGSHFVRAERGFRSDYELADAAPLDPSKVKAGDTVTLSADETSTRGPVKDVQYAGGGEWDVWIANHAQPFRTGRIGLWAVTDHQPAPEPELPTRGTFGWADTVDGRRHGFVVGGANGSDYRAFRYYLPESDYSRATESFSNFVPDVVIDPAAVDWRGLQARMSALVVGAEPFKRASDILAVVRRELGIEAP